MRRTELLQEVRIMRFEEVYGVWAESRLDEETIRKYIREQEKNEKEQLGFEFDE